ncbi:unnamed protein product, partial [Nesidiocoris tenuis]
LTHCEEEEVAAPEDALLLDQPRAEHRRGYSETLRDSVQNPRSRPFVFRVRDFGRCFKSDGEIAGHEEPGIGICCCSAGGFLV